MERVWGAKLEVDINNIIHNINSIKKYIGKDVDIMPIIKDNAYGTGIDTKIELWEKTDMKILGVAIVDEGIRLRESGYKGQIFILNQPLKEEINAISKYNLTIGVGSIEFLDVLGNFNSTFTIHMEIGTGMGRTGIKPERTKEYIEKVRNHSNLNLEGIYTHFSCSDCDDEYTKKQINSFEYAINQAKEMKQKFKYIHCCNSAGVISYTNVHFNLVRPGLILYGYYPDNSLKEKINLKPSLRLKSKITFIKEVEKGTSISYGKSFTTNRKSIIATVPLGYADGIRRSFSNRGNVVINGKLAPIIGKVCMDCFMIDITDIEGVTIGDEVYIWDNENITIEDIARIYDTINYEIIVGISERVIRENIEI